MSPEYRPALDGLRFVAIYLAVLFHAGVAWAGGGYIGVDIFFVLSGFLITGLIAHEIDKTGRLDFGTFYARRIRRLLPAAVVVIIATCLIFLLNESVARRIPLVGDAQSSLLYVANWRFVIQANDYFADSVERSPFLHFWSLSIEEQYYLLFPILMLVLLRRFGPRSLGPLMVLGGLFVASIAAQVYWGFVDPNHAYYGTDARLYQLLAGGLIALAVRRWDPEVPGRLSGVTAGVGVLSLLVLASDPWDWNTSLVGILAMLAASAAVFGLAFGGDRMTGRLLAARTPVYLGKISYGTYLWHWPIILVLDRLYDTSPLVIAAMTAVLATGMATASYEILEMPIRRGRGNLGRAWPVVAVGLTVSILVAIAVVPFTLERDRKPVVATERENTPDLAGVARSEQLPRNVDWQRIQDERGIDANCPPDRPRECVVVEGGGPHVLLVGDSHARMLTPMLAKLARDKKFTFSANTVPHCMWQDTLINKKARPDTEKECTSVRVGWYERALPELDPDVVILTHRPKDEEKRWSDAVQRRDGKDGGPLHRRTAEGSQETLQKIRKVADRVVLLDGAITPETFDPRDCLSGAEDSTECAVPVPVDKGFTDSFNDTEAAQHPDTFSVDLNKVLCVGAPLCQPVVAGTVVWRDFHHYTSDYVVARRQEAWRLLEKSGVFDGLAKADGTR